nr:unnamed protein product [Digitaria exilis]
MGCLESALDPARRRHSWPPPAGSYCFACLFTRLGAGDLWLRSLAVAARALLTEVLLAVLWKRERSGAGGRGTTAGEGPARSPPGGSGGGEQGDRDWRGRR